MANAMHIITDLLARELETVYDGLEMEVAEQRETHETKKAIKGTRVWLRKKALVQRRLYKAANLILRRNPK